MVGRGGAGREPSHLSGSNRGNSKPSARKDFGSWGIAKPRKFANTHRFKNGSVRDAQQEELSSIMRGIGISGASA